MRVQEWKCVVGAVALLASILSVPSFAQEKIELRPLEGPFVVAVLDFETKGKETASLGENIPLLLSAFLSMDDNLQLVERAQIEKIIEEMALGKTGIVNPQEAARIGYMTGARFLITGRVFIIGQQLYITSKVMSTETSKVSAPMAKGSTDGELEGIVQDLADKITTLLAEKGGDMLPKVVSERDLVLQLKKKLEGKKLPKFVVAVPERHMGRPIPDPAAETEVSYLLKACGATLISTKGLNLSNWAREFLKETGQEIPTPLHKADVIIIGEGFSEFAGSTGRLISAKARLELKAVDVKSGKILAVGRATATAVDLAENIAAKTALQKAASQISLKLIPEAVKGYNKLEAERK